MRPLRTILGSALLVLFATAGLSAQIFFAPPLAVASESGGTITATALLDADGDGDLDLVYGMSGGALPLRILIDVDGGGGLGFADESAARLPASIFDVQDLLAADLDGDGDQDLAVGTATGELIYLVNDGAGVFSDVTATRVTVGLPLVGPLRLAGGDLDGDGFRDLVVWSEPVSSAAPPFILWSDQGNGFPTLGQITLPAGLVLGAIDLDLVDIDADLDLDVLVTSVGSGSTFAAPFTNDGNGGFLLDPGIAPTSFAAIAALGGGLAPADLDGDGAVDLCARGPDALALARGLVPGPDFAALETGALLPAGGVFDAMPGGPRLADLDGDGDLDAISSIAMAPGSGRLGVSDNLAGLSGAGVPFATAFLLPLAPGVVPATPPAHVAVGDVDGDGDLDVFAVYADLVIALHENLGATDTTPPGILDVSETAPTLRAGLLTSPDRPRIRAVLQDAQAGPGVLGVTAQLEIESARDGEIQSVLRPMIEVGPSTLEGRLDPPSLGDGLAGASVRYRVLAGDAAGNATVSAWRSLLVSGTLAFGPTGGVHDVVLDFLGEPAAAEAVTVEIDSDRAGAACCLAVSPTRATNFFFGGLTLFDLGDFAEIELLTDPLGDIALPLVLPQDLVGERVIMQAFVVDATKPFGVALSRGLDVTIGGFESAGVLPVFPPAITALGPAAPAPGQLVTISGLNFDQGALVLLNGTPTPATVLGPTSITFVMPAIPFDCETVVTVVNENGQTALASIFPAPAVNHTVFGTGPVSGGATFILIGSNLGSGTTVLIDGNPALVTSASPTSVICITPPGTPGPKPTQVTNAYGCSVMTGYVYQ